MPHEIPDPQSFIDSYGPDAQVVFGLPPDDNRMTLGQALQFEALLCTAGAENRQDPVKRVGYLAHKLAAGGSLRPEHEFLLGELE